jgi:hypothetical protein
MKEIRELQSFEVSMKSEIGERESEYKDILTNAKNFKLDEEMIVHPSGLSTETINIDDTAAPTYPLKDQFVK